MLLAVPIAGPLTIVYLAMSSDTNRTNRTTTSHTDGTEIRSRCRRTTTITERSGP